MSNHIEMPGGEKLPVDEYGHLLNADDWSHDVAVQMAQQDGLELTEDHWLLITLLRDYYQEYGIEPPMRALVKELKARGGENMAGSLALYRLFPEGPVRQGSRYGGLPIPLSCI